LQVNRIQSMICIIQSKKNETNRCSTNKNVGIVAIVNDEMAFIQC